MAAEIQLDQAQLLSERIQILWAQQNANANTITRSKNKQAEAKAELLRVEVELAASLFEFKQRLAKAGRGGGWSAFLRDQGIPRTTGDRYVARHKRSIGPERVIAPSGAITEANAKQVTHFITKLAPKLAHLLVYRLPSLPH